MARKEFFTKTRFDYLMEDSLKNKNIALNQLKKDWNHGADRNQKRYPEPQNKTFGERLRESIQSVQDNNSTAHD